MLQISLRNQTLTFVIVLHPLEIYFIAITPQRALYVLQWNPETRRERSSEILL